MKPNRLKQALKAGEGVVGTMLHEVLNPEVAYLLAAAGMDFLMMDTEHASVGTENIQSIARAAKSAGLVPLARATNNEYSLIARLLDLGVMGIMVPRVNTRDQAEHAVACIKYPPQGHRGFGMRGVVTDYERTSVRDAMRWANENTLVILQIESGEAVANLEEIARVPGVDVCLIGLNDLSISLGAPGEFNHPEVEKAVRRVFEVVSRNHVSPAVHFFDLELGKRYREMGMRLFLYGTESQLLLQAASEAVQRLAGKQQPAGTGLY